MRLLVLAVAAGCLMAQPPLFPSWPAVWSSYDTRPKDCHRGLRDGRGRLILVGIETFGDLRTEAARQAVTLLVNERGFWSEPIRVSAPGIVYFSAFTVDSSGRVWIAWSEFGGGVWRVMARSWDRGALGPAEELSRGSSVSLQPDIAALPSGEIFAAWEAEAGGRFEIRGCSWKNGKWSGAQTISRGGDHEFRPALAADSNGVLWITWDRATGSRYRTIAKYREASGWSREMDPFGEAENPRAPQIAADGSGRVWVLASGQLAGLDRSGQRFELPDANPWRGGPDFFSIDPKGRFWLFKSLGQRASFDWMAAWRNARIEMAVVDSGGLHTLPEMEAATGYAAPQVDADGNVWVMNSIQFLRFANPYPKAAGAPVAVAAPARGNPAGESARQWPRYEVRIAGKAYRVFWAEMHNHLQELPPDRNIATWVDRLYLSARHRDGLDALALTDHDWPGMKRSMYYVEQGIAKVLDAPGRFAAITGYEWSGDSQVRARFGDRTVLFPAGYHDIARITDDAADTAQKLSGRVKQIGALDWPHHIGRAESPVNPKYLNPETEPVMEMTSGHGVFETYDRKQMVPVPFHTQIIPGTSVQDALALGKRVGMVGSSDSHTGYSGYRVGMLAILAPELTREALLDAIRARRAYAIRGGEPILVDFRVDGHFMGESYTSAGKPRIRIAVTGSKAITRIELVRNNRYVLSKDYTDDARERALEFQDEAAPPAYYYARITQGPGQWAWTSPVWVDPPASGKRWPWAAGAALILMAAGWGRFSRSGSGGR